MSHLYTIVAIVGLSLAVVLAAAAIAMFFALRIKEVRDDLSGKTAARSIAEIRSRAKTRTRGASAAAKGLGWEREVSTDEIAGFAAGKGEAGAAAASAAGRPALDDEPATQLLAGKAENDADEPATVWLDEREPATAGGAR